MESPGEYLKRERELRGIALDKVCSALKISTKTLRSIESDDYSALPHEAYVKGFIKSYARFLGMDEHDAALRFDAYLREKAESAEEKKKKEERLNAGFSPEQPKREQEEAKFRWKAPDAMTLAPVLVLLGVLILAVYVVFSGTGKKDAEKTAVVTPQQESSVSQDASPATDAKTLSKETKKKSEFNVLAVKTEPQMTVPANVKAAPTKAEPTKIEPPKTEPAKTEPTKAVAPVKESEKPAAALKPAVVAPLVQSGGGNVLVITAKEDVWVKVEADSKEPFEMLMREGDKKKVEATVFF